MILPRVPARTFTRTIKHIELSSGKIGVEVFHTFPAKRLDEPSKLDLFSAVFENEVEEDAYGVSDGTHRDSRDYWSFFVGRYHPKDDVTFDCPESAERFIVLSERPFDWQNPAVTSYFERIRFGYRLPCPWEDAFEAIMRIVERPFYAFEGFDQQFAIPRAVKPEELGRH